MFGFIAMVLITTTTNYGSFTPVVQEIQSYMYAQEVDVTADSGITRYVGPHDPLTTPRYKPIDLVDLTDAAFIVVQ